jgi:hypothetical protein
MGLLDKIKSMFSKGNLPEETQLLLSGVADVVELRKGLDEIVTRNEVEARDIEREIEKLAKMETAQKERIAGGDMNRREKTNTLREIQRLRRRMTSLEKRHRIHQDNIDLHLGLFDRITEMEAMELKRVTQDQIEEISVDYDERVEKHRDIMHAARAATGLEGSYTDSVEAAELAALEREILEEAGVGAEEEEPPQAEEKPAPEEKAEEKPEEKPEEQAAPRRKPIEQAMAELETAKTQDDNPALEVE